MVMKSMPFLLLTLFMALTALGHSTNSLELSFFSRYDRHANYTTRWGERSYRDAIKLWGPSYRLQFHYLHPVSKILKAGVGIGYSKLGVDNVRASTPSFRNVPSRNINYTFPSGIRPLVSTDKYHYNNFIFSAGLQYEQGISEKLSLTAGTDFNYMYTFSQFYHIPFGNIDYRTNRSRPLGFGVNASIGFLRKVLSDRFYINPAFILPLYQQLNGDEVFREAESVKMRKLLYGAGLSIAIGRYF
jgi:hypothetical protein